MELRRLTKVFLSRNEPTVALENLSLDIARGEFAVILGPSGCGKSTIIRIIAGLEQPTSGTARVNGNPLSLMLNHHKVIGRLPAGMPALDEQAGTARDQQLAQSTRIGQMGRYWPVVHRHRSTEPIVP